jgi:diguanylate cyclase (GGDEF)-like protein
VGSLLRTASAVVPVVTGVLAVGTLLLLGRAISDDVRLGLVAVGAGSLGAAVAGGLVLAWMRWRFGGLVTRAERLGAAAAGLSPAERSPGPLDGPGGSSLAARLDVALTELAERLSSAHEAATIDRLTGVASRSALLTALFAEVDRAVRYNRPLSIAFVDVDHFKTINDTWGHAAGDAVLRGIAQVLRANLRSAYLVGRYGGEEFLLVLGETSPEEAWLLAEKLRAIVAQQRFDVGSGATVGVTISIGIAGGRGRNLRVEALVHHADMAMYSAKALGRDQAYVFAEPDDTAAVPRAPVSPGGRARAVEVGRSASSAAIAHLAGIAAGLEPDARDPGTIPVTVGAMARRLGLPAVEAERLSVASVLHDLGKLAVPRSILAKPGPLTDADWRAIIQHPRIGQVVLDEATKFRDAGAIILHHHERFAGHGYPHGLRGTDIPLGSRILAIADAYDAMTRARPHRGAMTHTRAIAELRRHAGTQFDPELVEVFCELYERRPPALPGPAPAAADAAELGVRQATL